VKAVIRHGTSNEIRPFPLEFASQGGLVGQTHKASWLGKTAFTS